MRQFSRRGVFELAKKRQLLLKHSIDQLVDDTLLRFRSLGIPLNGAYLSIYFSVLEKATSYNPLNSSTVIENFVEVLLRRVPLKAFSGPILIIRIRYICSVIACERMVRADKYLVPYDELYDWFKEYFDLMGLKRDSAVAIKYFVNAHIFWDIGNSIAFRHNLFLSFFIANRMQRDVVFRAWLTEARYLSFVHELELYAGLVRDDETLLKIWESVSRAMRGR